jgi:hypothetical protein
MTKLEYAKSGDKGGIKKSEEKRLYEMAHVHVKIQYSEAQGEFTSAATFQVSHLAGLYGST